MVVIFEAALLIFLICCALAVSLTKRLLTAVIIFMSYSSIMAVLWVTLNAPDLAMTEAAVGAGITTLLLFITLKKVGELERGKK